MVDELQPWNGLFDFSNPAIQDWEVKQIREAEQSDELLIPSYAVNRARDYSIEIRSIRKTIALGQPFEKDLPTHESRQPGIAFKKGERQTKRSLKVKVGYLGSSYSVVTAHHV